MIEREEIIVLLKADIQHEQKHRLQPSTTLESISCVRFSVFLRRFQLSSRERTLISQEIPQSLKLILTDLPKNVPSICHVDFFWCWKCQWRDTLTRAGYQYRLALSINITACTSSSDLSETFDEFIFLFTCCALSVEIYHRGPWGTWLFWLVQEQEIVISELTIFWDRLFFYDPIIVWHLRGTGGETLDWGRQRKGLTMLLIDVISMLLIMLFLTVMRLLLCYLLPH